MRKKKRHAVFGWLLIAAMISQIIFPAGNPEFTQAAETGNKENTMLETENMSVVGTDSFGEMLSQALSQETEQEENQSCHISDITVEGNAASVSLETDREATLVVGIYTEDGMEMTASGITQVTPDTETVTVDIAAEEMPQYFLVRAFLLDSDYSPLCLAFESSLYTEEVQDILKKTVNDFDQDKVLNLDDSADNNFAVYKESVKQIKTGTGKNHIVSGDLQSGKYVIENADETIRKLKAGDIFAGQKEDGETVIVKVKSVVCDGTTVTVTQEETELDEVFDYVKVDTESGMDKVQIDNSSCDDGVVYHGLEDGTEELQTYALDGEHKEEKTAVYTFQESDKDAVLGLSGSIKLNTSAYVKIYLAKKYQYLKVELKHSASLTVDAKMKVDGKVKLGQFTFAPVPGVYIQFTPSLVTKLSAKISMSGKLEESIGFIFQNDIGIRNISSEPSFKPEVKIDGTFFIGLSMEPKIKIVSDSIAAAGMDAQMGVEISADKDLLDSGSDSKKHDCEQCIAGEINGKAEVNFYVKLLENKKLKLAKKFEWTIKITDFYYSITHDEFGWQTCPYIKYKVTVSTVDSQGNPLENVLVNNEVTTDSAGNAILYLPNGTYNIPAKKEGYGSGSKEFTIENASKKIKIVVNTVEETGYKIQQVSLGGQHSAAITEEGDLYLWGGNVYGQLGTGGWNWNGDATPNKILKNVKQVSLGGQHSAAITENGDLYLWGCGYLGQIGNGTYTMRNERIKIMEHVKQVSLSELHSAAITENGDLYLWGDNRFGQIGDGSTYDSPVPKKVMEHVKQVSLSKLHSAAITENGDLYLWGDGLLGDGSVEGSLSPKKIMEHVKEVSLGNGCSAAITEKGDLYLWGGNLYGQIGDGSTENSFLPKKIMENVKEVSLGNGHSAAITETGDLYLWGYNIDGQIGDGTVENSLKPKKIMENVKKVSLGWEHSAIITENGDLYLWGYNGFRQLGDGSTENSLNPKKITITSTSSVDSTYELQNISAPIYLAVTEKQAVYENLMPGKEYIFYVLKSEMEETLFTSENILYFAQGIADKDGKLYFSYRISGYSGSIVEKISSAGKFSTGEVTGISGDVNADGIFNMADAALVRRYVANMDVSIDTLAADVNKDSKVDMVDYALMRRALANWDVELK